MKPTLPDFTEADLLRIAVLVMSSGTDRQLAAAASFIGNRMTGHMQGRPKILKSYFDQLELEKRGQK